MKIPSIDYLVQNAKTCLVRFPWVLAAACGATGLSIWLMELNYADKHRERIVHFLMALYVGISLFFALSMFLERIRLPRRFEALVFFPALGLLGLYAYSMEGQSEFVVASRYALFLLASHLFVAAAPYLRAGYSRGFWEYNHRLFLRIIVSAVFSGCIFLGLTAAVAAVKHLFNIDVDDKIYARLFLIVSGILNTWLFLAGVPRDFEDLERDHPYPRVIQILTQYILVPLVTLYLLILYAYALKIGIEREWPVGWVSYLVLICSLLGIFSMLLVHPIQELRENQWIKAFSRNFYLILLPLLILLFASIGRRISEYRLTENRYFVVAMALWLTGIALYFTFSRVRNIKVVPISLCLLALVTSCGPWGAFQVAGRSQIGRLHDLLQNQGMLKDGKIIRVSGSITKEKEAEIGSVLLYLEQRRMLQTLRPWLPNSDSIKVDSILENRHTVLNHIGLKFVDVDRYGNISEISSRAYYASTGVSSRITGFDYMLTVDRHNLKDTSYTVVPEPDRCELQIIPDSAKIRMKSKGATLLEFNLKPFLDSLQAANPGSWNNGIAPERMYLELEGGGYKAGLQVRSIHSDSKTDGFQNISATVFVKIPGKIEPSAVHTNALEPR